MYKLRKRKNGTPLCSGVAVCIRHLLVSQVLDTQTKHYHCQNLWIKMAACVANCRNTMLEISVIEEAAALPIPREWRVFFPSQCDLFFVLSSGNSVKLGNVVMDRGWNKMNASWNIAFWTKRIKCYKATLVLFTCAANTAYRPTHVAENRI